MAQNQPTVTLTRDQLQKVANAIVEIYEAIDEALNGARELTTAPRPTSHAAAPAAPTAQPAPTNTRVGADLTEDSPKGEMARRWLEFCQEHNIGQSAASSYLARAKGHYKNAMRLYEQEQPLG